MKEEEKTKEQEKSYKIGVTATQPIAKYCNYVKLSLNKDDNEAVFDFVFIDRNTIDKEKGMVTGFHLDRIAMSITHAKKFKNMLTDMLKKL